MGDKKLVLEEVFYTSRVSNLLKQKLMFKQILKDIPGIDILNDQGCLISLGFQNCPKVESLV